MTWPGGPGKAAPVYLEKEAKFVNEILAKLNQNDKLIGGGAIVVAVGWLFGIILGNRTAGGYSAYGISIPGYSVNYFSWGTAGLVAGLALTVAIAAVVVLFLKVAPNMNITWPVPVGQILLGLAVAALAFAALTVLFQLTNGLDGAPILMFIADLIFVGGAAAMAFGAFTEYSKKTA